MEKSNDAIIKKIIEEGIAKEKKQFKERNKIEIDLPKEGKLISHFVKEISKELHPTNTIFYRSDSKDIVEIEQIKSGKQEDDTYSGFVEIKPNRFITLIEKYIVPGNTHFDTEKKCYTFSQKSMGRELSNTCLHSEILQNALPKIQRIFTIPVPIIYNGELTFPKRGYDERFESWLSHDSPKIENQEMEIDDAKLIFKNLLKEFCFQDRQDYTNAIAAILTPFLRGIFPSFNTRTPVFFYIANRERAGKDYLAGIRGIIYEGHALEESPISNSENSKSNNTDELRKKILSAMISGRKRLHFANNKGYINNAVFEAITTAERYSDRVLGKNEILSFDNEIDFSLSGNVGVGFTPDFANRSRFIRLFLDIEDANSREFDNPNLHLWVKNNRGLMLSAMYALIKNWIKCGKPTGSIPFSSFPSWADTCGGIMECAGYDNPCNPDKETLSLGGDMETTDMKQLFELCYEAHPNGWLTKNEIRMLIKDNEESMFGYLDFTKTSDQVKFGLKIIKFIGRVLSDIRLIADNNPRASRRKFKFTKEAIENDKSKIFKDNFDEKLSKF